MKLIVIGEQALKNQYLISVLLQRITIDRRNILLHTDQVITSGESGVAHGIMRICSKNNIPFRYIPYNEIKYGSRGAGVIVASRIVEEMEMSAVVLAIRTNADDLLVRLVVEEAKERQMCVIEWMLDYEPTPHIRTSNLADTEIKIDG